jgi:uncharacterized protein involved in response to NO
VILHATPQDPSPAPPRVGLAFRCGFLAAPSFGVLAMGRWLYWMMEPTAWDYTVYPVWWHAHEMVFGFAMPVVASYR